MKIAICDDEKFFRDTISAQLSDFNTIVNNLSVYEFENGLSLITAYRNKNSFDIIFLDIEMKGISGIETGKQIREMDKKAVIIFITSHQEYVPDAFRINAFQFLTKPVNPDDFTNEMNRAIKSIKQCKEKYLIKTANTTHVLEMKDIIYIEVFNQ